MTYDAVSAYTVLLGDGVAPTTVSVHGSAADAWHALDAAVTASAVRGGGARRGRRHAWRVRAAPRREPATVEVVESRVRETAERWRLADPGRRFWNVTSHRLQVTVPAIGTPRT